MFYFVVHSKESRYGRKRKAVENSEKVAEKILKNYISSEVINGELGIRGKGTKLPKLKKNQERDLFELSPLPSRLSRQVSASTCLDCACL